MRIFSFKRRHPAITHVGKYTYGIKHVRVFEWGEGAHLTIGNFCSIGSNIRVYLGGNHRTDWVTTYPFGHIFKRHFPNCSGAGHPATKGDVVIGNDVWIAENVIIMSGVHIGDGAVLANSALVTKDVPPYAIVGGNPAQVIRFRFPEDQIQRLCALQWWDWPDQKIDSFLPLMCNTDIEAFLQKAEQEA
jgi:acetyltransferase-like isoleucine patch superfamily enzyme